jgi:hypothetical protein
MLCLEIHTGAVRRKHGLFHVLPVHPQSMTPSPDPATPHLDALRCPRQLCDDHALQYTWSHLPPSSVRVSIVFSFVLAYAARFRLAQYHTGYVQYTLTNNPRQA